MAARRVSQLDNHFMRIALRLAAKALGSTSPNPAVGCVIARASRVVGIGATAPGGRPHAETRALKAAGKRARRATAYVTLEPCAHQGQTPPCARALIESGLSRVVVGCIDPYPKVRGRGIAMLRRAGIDVSVGVLEEECRRVNEGFITRVTRGRPFVILKLAMSLDGRIAASSGGSRWISSSESRQLVHQWRSQCDAVMVGAGTVIADDPRLTCRMPGGRDPVRVVLDGRLRVSHAARLFHVRSKAPAILVTSNNNLRRAQHRYGARTEVVGAPSRAGKISLAGLMSEFGRRGWSKIMIEGGAHLAGAALEAGVVDKIAVFVAPKILGAGLPAVEGIDVSRVHYALRLHNLSARRVGSDWLMEADLTSRR